MEADEYARIATAQGAHWWYRSTRALMADVLEPWLGSASRILDAGCGPGGNGAWLNRYAPTVGVDASTVALRLARDRTATRAVQGQLEDLPFPDGTFDIVVAITVAYAIDDDRAAIGELTRVVAPGGALLLVEPAFDALRRAHDDQVHGKRRYRRRQLAAMVTGLGLTVARSTYAYSFLAPPAAVLGALERRRPTPEPRSDVDRTGLDPVFGPLAALERRWLRDHDVPVGTSAVVLATRP